MNKVINLVLFLIFVCAILFLQRDLNADNTSIPNHYVLKETPVKVIWREDVYDKDLKEKVNTIKLNENYFANISEPEKAVLGYLATTIGNECYSDGNKSNIKCKILSALNLSYQCSEANKTFLRGWFQGNAEIMSQVENCVAKPTSPVIEKTFDEVTISANANMINVKIKGLNLNFKDGTSQRWSEDMSFQVSDNRLVLLDRKKKD